VTLKSIGADPQSSSTATTASPIGPFTELPTQISNKPPEPDQTLRQLATTDAIATSLIGQQLMHFQLEQFVGGGGMGAVFRGRDLTLGRTVAVKVLSQDHIDEDMIRRFRHEAQSAAKLDHPAIPHVYYVGEQDGWYFIVFEFIEGENIRDYVAKQGALSIRQAIIFLADIAEALQHASDRDVVHRDIKPSNVLVTHDGQAKLVDMGLARSQQIQSTANDLTATGVTLGTFDYISPEQARDPRLADARSDIYSLGCTLYFMLTGRPPFPDGTMLQKLLSHTSEAPPDPSQFRSDVPPQLTMMLSRMLAKHPEHRYQQPAELLGDILILANELDITLNASRQTTVVVERPIVVASLGWRRHIPWLVPLVILLLMSLALHPRWGWHTPPDDFPMPALPASAETSSGQSDISPRNESPTESGPVQSDLPPAEAPDGYLDEPELDRRDGFPQDTEVDLD
jgi:serine/threonine-protein kinase